MAQVSPSSPAQMPSPSPHKIMPVVQPDGVVGGQNVVKSKGVGGVTRQARTGSTPFTEEPLSSMRRTIAKRLSEAKVCIWMCVYLCLWVCMCFECEVCVLCLCVSVLSVCCVRVLCVLYVCVTGVTSGYGMKPPLHPVEARRREVCVNAEVRLCECACACVCGGGRYVCIYACMACMCNVFIVLIRVCLLISMYVLSYTVHVCYVCANSTYTYVLI